MKQASLPARMGGLGIGVLTNQMALSAIFALYVEVSLFVKRPKVKSCLGARLQLADTLPVAVTSVAGQRLPGTGRFTNTCMPHFNFNMAHGTPP